MKHSIRERIIDPIRGKIVKVSTINAELGSGITDKNGKEIFEGDKVKLDNKTYKVICGWGNGLALCDYKNNCQDLQEHTDIAHNKGCAFDLEVVGHVED